LSFLALAVVPFLGIVRNDTIIMISNDDEERSGSVNLKLSKLQKKNDNEV